jgi:hypothetical protein
MRVEIYDDWKSIIHAIFYDVGTDTVYHNNRTTEGWIP